MARHPCQYLTLEPASQALVLRLNSLTMTIFEGLYFIISKSSDAALELNGSGISGKPRKSTSGSHLCKQLWLLELCEDRDSFVIRNVETNTVMDICGGSVAEGTAVIGFPRHLGDNQRWRISLVDGSDE